ncbi:MAG: S8 family serine peptidase [bacterium]
MKTNIKISLIIFILTTFLPIYDAVGKEKMDELIKINPDVKHKVGSGTLIFQASSILKKNKLKLAKGIISKEKLEVALYLESYPTTIELNTLESMGIDLYRETWTPSTLGHKLGFMLAQFDPALLTDVIDVAFIKLIESVKKKNIPHNNTAAQNIMIDSLHISGWEGARIVIGVLDSGLDTEPTYQDLPSSITKKDYSYYPTLDDDVENQVTGHGTHVTGSVLGRGTLSLDNTINGGGSYKGMAPNANLIFLKIGNDMDGSASSSAIIAALDAAIDVYNVDIITMSYGGWNEYLDGSTSMDQKIDWCYNQGVPVFISAGNEANDNRHYSGSVSGNSETDFIAVNVQTQGDSAQLNFNLLWYDNDGNANNLDLTYYDIGQNLLTDITKYSTTQSSRLTNSQCSYYNSYIKTDGTFYLKIENTSATSQNFHIYEFAGDGSKVTFNTPDPNYTISSPATADNAFCVGAWTSRKKWTDWQGNGPYSFTTGETQDDICTFSSRGPRVDNVQKPDIAAPGSAIISLRDRDMYTSPSAYWIDNDGVTGSGEKNYYVNQGTSMACPVAAGSAALLLQKDSTLTPLQLYEALKNNAARDGYTGSVPNDTWGYGKLDINSAFEGAKVKIKIFLEGPYQPDTDEMTIVLNDYGVIPTTSPYPEDPCTVDSIPGNVTDWVLVQLRSTPTGDAVFSKSYFLSNDGMIVGRDGITETLILGVSSGNYYIVIQHRNHLAVMSNDIYTLSSSNSTMCDFTTSSDKYEGTDAAFLETGVYGMYAGDASNNQEVQNSDKNDYWKVQVGLGGYRSADFNLNGEVQNNDKNDIWKSNVGKGTLVSGL